MKRFDGAEGVFCVMERTIGSVFADIRDFFQIVQSRPYTQTDASVAYHWRSDKWVLHLSCRHTAELPPPLRCKRVISSSRWMTSMSNLLQSALANDSARDEMAFVGISRHRLLAIGRLRFLPCRMSLTV
jgi:hypothetical protein